MPFGAYWAPMEAKRGNEAMTETRQIYNIAHAPLDEACLEELRYWMEYTRFAHPRYTELSRRLLADYEALKARVFELERRIAAQDAHVTEMIREQTGLRILAAGCNLGAP